ncbi:DUF2625 domain-containing protein [Chitinophaga oryzae]|uniref:DUF2625 domain-containing protein n=1 Tax=Chitinophaga oryzae TaxID=2725414 RepID=A0AAE6ZDG4_9BACT|nr:DUF2625 domain-containing protein [Chitinophaga oryzae]QJB30921.1 DUF2625 domain-containing protein [Chitinophaga oryzae]QJB37410.1 DUF2625 domain-containing protein [Chitinophaga oryzae]
MHDHHLQLLGVNRLLTVVQTPKKSLGDLINTQEPGWELVTSWIGDATHKVTVLPATESKAKETLYATQVTTRSPMGAIIFNSGGILVDHGWIRILGSGHNTFNRTLHSWNINKTIFDEGNAGFLLVADDAAGGFFAINSGGLGEDMGKVYYFDPAAMAWEALDISYSEFLLFCFEGDLGDFYRDLRWSNWEQEVSMLDGNEVFSFYPMLWTKEGKDINSVHRAKVPVEEHYGFTTDMLRQLDGAK